MAKANKCLKCFFIFFNVLLGITGCVLMVLGVMASHYEQELGQEASSLAWIYVIAVACIILSFMGTLGAYKEKPLLLKLFGGGMLVGGIILFSIANSVAEGAPELKKMMKESMGHLKDLMMESKKLKADLIALQAQAECCGVVSYRDWGGDIPESCECSSQDTDRCALAETSQSYGLYRKTLRVYMQPCGAVMVDYIDQAAKAAVRFLFGFASVAIVGLLLSVILVCQMGGACDTTPAGGVDNVTANVPNMSYYPLTKGGQAHTLLMA